MKITIGKVAAFRTGCSFHFQDDHDSTRLQRWLSIQAR
jgi:hypothetical protein